MIGYAIWDQTHLIANRYLRQYIRDTFYELQLDFGDMPIHHDLEHLIEQSTAAHLVVFHSGHTSRSVARFKAAVAELCEQDFLVAGHLLYRNTYPQLHPQMLVLNLDHYRHLGSPMIGYKETGPLDLHQPSRSPDNIHDNYTPLWLRPTERRIVCRSRDFGWHLIHSSLDHGLSVLNLPNDVRWTKRYLYPEEHPHQFADCLRQLAQDRLTTIPVINPNQQEYLRELLQPGVHCRSYLFNTERLTEPVEGTVHRLFGVAAGFKLFVLWHRLGGEVVYFDHSHTSLCLWQDIVAHWSGRDFAGFCRQSGYDDDFSKMAEVIAAVGGEDALAARWQAFQRSTPRFIWCDVLREPERLVEQMTDTGNCVWYSNCFEFFEAIRQYGLAGARAREQRFREMVLARAPDTILLDSSPIRRNIG